MSELSTASGHEYSADDERLAEFVQELERLGVEAVDLEAWIGRFPHLESRFRQLHVMYRALEGSRPQMEPPMPDRLGEFRIVRRLPGGHLGEVYEAVQEPLNRRVAVKTIRRGRISAELHTRFLREQKVLASLHQTHIIPIHTAGYDSGLQYFAMPYIDGAALNNVVALVNDLHSSHPGSQTPPLGELARAATKHATAADVPTVTRVGAVSLAVPKSASGAAVSRRRLSAAYTRSMSVLMADVADAVHYAHQQGILHRDIKPANIMIDAQEQGWIIDFGLARHLSEAETAARDSARTEAHACKAAMNGHAESRRPEPHSEGDGEFVATRGMIGTPSYMAPEQFSGAADARSEVWGLGATLYELLTLQRPFTGSKMIAIERAVREESPPRPRTVVDGVPHDLEAICLKAMHKEPSARYQSAAEFGMDLRRWLNTEPTRARPAHAVRRAILWSRRNPGWALVLFTTLIAASVLWAMQVLHVEARRGTAVRESAITKMQRIRLTPLRSGWAQAVSQLVNEAAAVEWDARLRDEAAASLVGLDAETTLDLDFRSSAVAFRGDSQQLLIGGGIEGNTRLWLMQSNSFKESQQAGFGPVAFSSSGDGLQWTAVSPWSFVLWNVSQQRAFCQVSAPLPAGIPEPVEVPLLRRLMVRVKLAISRDGTLMAASVPQLDEQGKWAEDQGETFVWNERGELLQRVAGAASALQFAPDRSLLGVGRDNGNIELFSLSDGRLQAKLTGGRNRIHALDISRNPSRQEGPPQWLLAAGDAGGGVVIWDVATGVPRSRCLGSHWDVYAVCFSPDGMTLASGGRQGARLWDALSGKMLLQITGTGDYITGLAFSENGDELAVSSQGFPIPAGRGHTTSVWSIQRGRGMDLLTGVSAQIVHTCWSRDGSLLAALGQDWRIGVYELHPPRLKYLLDCPRGSTADNAALAFSVDNRMLAASAGETATAWDLETGELRFQHQLPPGLIDQLAFTANGRLLSFRAECADGLTAPMGDAHPEAYPRVIRLRNLLGDQPLRPLAEIPRFNWHVLSGLAHPQGDYFVAEGLHRGSDGDAQEIIAFDGRTGSPIWKQALAFTGKSSFTIIDPMGDRIGFFDQSRSVPVQVRLPSGEIIDQLSTESWALGLNGGTTLAPSPVRFDGSAGTGIALSNRENAEPYLTLGIDFDPHPISPRFSPDGRQLAFGTKEGHVVLCDLPRILQQLFEIGVSP